MSPFHNSEPQCNRQPFVFYIGVHYRHYYTENEKATSSIKASYTLDTRFVLAINLCTNVFCYEYFHTERGWIFSQSNVDYFFCRHQVNEYLITLREARPRATQQPIQNVHHSTRWRTTWLFVSLTTLPRIPALFLRYAPVCDYGIMAHKATNAAD